MMNALQVKLGHHFSDLNLLNLALTHRSCGARNNERMEFLGDSILNFVAADYIYERFPRLEEGSMSRVRAALICEKTLVKVAKRLELGLHIKRNARYTEAAWTPCWPMRLKPCSQRSTRMPATPPQRK